jgi:hypothetical protein
MEVMVSGITTHSTGAELACLSSDNLKAWLDTSRPVNSSVGRFAFITQLR